MLTLKRIAKKEKKKKKKEKKKEKEKKLFYKCSDPRVFLQADA